MKKSLLIGFLFLFPCARARGADNAVEKRLEAIEKRVEDLFQLLLKQHPKGGEEEAKRLRALETRVKALEALEADGEDLEDEEGVMLQEKVAVLTKELDSWRNRCDALETQLAQLRNHNTDQEKKKWDEMRANYRSFMAKYEDLTRDLSAVQKQKDEVVQQLKESLAQNDARLAEKDRKDDENLVLRKGLGALKKKLEGIKGVREKDGSWTPDLENLLETVSETLLRANGLLFDVPIINGSVAGVSNKVNLAVINVGEEDGVRVGFEFTIYREKSYVGKMVVEKVFPRQAACRVILDKTKDKVRVGDQVTTRVE